VTGKSLREGPKSPIGVNVIDYDRSTGAQNCKSPIEFEAYILFTVQAVMDKEVNLPKVRKYTGKAALACSPYIRPAWPESIGDRYANFGLPNRFLWRKVDTPQMSNSVSFQCLKDKPRCNAMQDSGLNDILRP